MKASELRSGMALRIDGQIWLVSNTDHVKPGKGPAYAQTRLKNVRTGANVEKRLRSAEEVDRVDLDRRQVEYLYSDANEHVFMDSDTFEQFPIPESVMGGKIEYVKPNTRLTGLFYSGNCLAVELPSAVELEVSETPPGIKDATKTNQLKEAVLETGMKTKVPPFITNGETIRVSTENGQYISRA